MFRLWQSVSPSGLPENAYAIASRRTTARLSHLWHAIRSGKQFGIAHSHTQWREAVPMRNLQQTILEFQQFEGAPPNAFTATRFCVPRVSVAFQIGRRTEQSLWHAFGGSQLSVWLVRCSVLQSGLSQCAQTNGAREGETASMQRLWQTIREHIEFDLSPAHS